MNTLPPELHAYICQLACTDDVSTIRALNGISRYFNELSKPFLYSNVSVSGVRQVMALLERLETIPPRMRHIRHLFLSDTKYSENPSSLSPLQNLDSLNLMRIVMLAAPTLESLSFVAQSRLTSTSLIARLLRTTFPLLRSLTVSGFYPFPSSPKKFPRLEYLHLIGNRNPTGLLLMSALEDACPCLTHLKVSGLGLAGSFLIELEEALQRDNSDDDSSCVMPARLPPHVKLVTVQAGPDPSPASPRTLVNTTHMKDKVMMARLEILKRRKVPDGNGIRVSVLDRSAFPISAEDIRTEWLANLA